MFNLSSNALRRLPRSGAAKKTDYGWTGAATRCAEERFLISDRATAAGSRLYMRLTGGEYGLQMPPTGPLSAGEINIIKKWIDQGAEWPDALSGETPPPPPDAVAGQIMDAIRRGDRPFDSEADA